jgi:hypothetical protein
MPRDILTRFLWAVMGGAGSVGGIEGGKQAVWRVRLIGMMLLANSGGEAVGVGLKPATAAEKRDFLG